MRRGFTLIELLIVLAILGLLGFGLVSGFRSRHVVVGYDQHTGFYLGVRP